MDQRKNEIKSAYKSLGKAHSLYDGMMTGSTVFGKLISCFSVYKVKCNWIGDM
ncbi:MAG: hypothetical protein IJ683_14555 [Butyrivibrio sp.]|nr:hypothetical protein [Butyrivibrio sp.]MBR1643529.1 hypothetical protein [Butyrivibrio sp.]